MRQKSDPIMLLPILFISLVPTIGNTIASQKLIKMVKEGSIQLLMLLY
jgi:hypothetical protein